MREKVGESDLDRGRLCGLLLGVLFCLSLALSWGNPLFSSHYSRQTQTAQTTDVFVREGWDPLLPKVRFFGRPGYTVLEFPVYQSAVAGLCRITPLSVEQSGRIVALLSALLCVWGMARLLRFAGGGLALPGAAWALSSPLIFGLSQWQTVELTNGAFGIWSLVFFTEALAESRPWRRIFLLGGLFLAAAVSLAIKPIMIYAFFPAFVFFLFRGFAWRRFLGVALACVLATGLAALWHIHAGKVNASVHNAFGIQGNIAWYFFSASSFQLQKLVKLTGRYFVYVLGPGTLLILLFCLFRERGKLWANWEAHKGLILSLLLGVVVYTLTFLNLNIEHNYYQLPGAIALYLALILLVGRALDSRAGLAVLFVAALANVAVAQARLAKQDADWAAAIHFLAPALENSAGDLLMVGDNTAAYAAAGFYLHRYMDTEDVNTLDRGRLRTERAWVAVCDSDFDGYKEPGGEDGFHRCIQRVRETFGPQLGASAAIGHLWVAVGNTGATKARVQY